MRNIRKTIECSNAFFLYKKIKAVFVPEINPKKMLHFFESNKGKSSIGEIETIDKTLAVIVPCYGHAQYLTTALESIFHQTDLPDEIIIIDDCSPDNTFETVTQLVQKQNTNLQKRITVLRNPENIGQAATLNKAIALAKSNLIMILNDDDYLFENIIETSKSLLIQNKQLAFIGFTSIWFTSEEQIQKYTPKRNTQIRLTFHYPEQVLRYRLFNDLNSTHSGSVFYKRAWELCGKYYSNKEDRLVPFSDRDFQFRLALLFPIAVAMQDPFVFWRSDSSVDELLNS